MAELQHKNIPNAQLHEPKRIAAATTADAGKILTPSSSTNGESELRNLDYTELDNAPTIFTPEYASAIVSNASSTFNIASGNLDTDGDYDNITSAYASDLGLGADFGTTNPSQFTVNTSGVYKLSITISGTVQNTGTGEAIVAFKYRTNTTFSTRKYKVRATTTTLPFSINIEEVISFSAGDTIDIHAAANKNTTLVVQDSNASIHLIEAS